MNRFFLARARARVGLPPTLFHRIVCVLGAAAGATALSSVVAGEALAFAPPAEGDGGNGAVEGPASPNSLGTISGVVTKRDGQEPVEGAIVVVQCSCLNEEVSVLTNARGIYRLSGLPAGVYTVQALYDDLENVRTVELPRGQKMRANLSLDKGRGSGSTTTIIVTKPIDSSVAHSGDKFDGETIRQSTPGSTVSNGAYDKIIDLSPTANDGPGGRKTVLGESDLQQRYTLNDHEVSDPTIGSVGAQPIAEFVGSAEVLESGYEAQYGGASGGQFRARRIAGTNIVRGTAGLRFTPRLAEPRFIMDTDEALRVTSVPEWGGAAFATVRGPIVKDRLFFSVGVNVSGARHTLTQSFHHRVDLDESGGFTPCPYENGTNDCVTDGNYIATRKFAEQTFPTGGMQVGWLGGLDWRINSRHSLGLTVSGGPSFSRTSYRLPFSVDPASFGSNPAADPLGGGARIATGIVNGQFGTDLSLSNVVGLEYHGRALQDRLEIDAAASYWQGSSQVGWRLDDPAIRDQPAAQETSAGGRNLIEYLDRDNRTSDIPGVEEACNSTDIPGDACPVRTWVSGGMGNYERDVARRVQGSFSFTHFVNSKAGNHQVKWGGEVSYLQRDSRYAYSGSNSPGFYDNCDAGELGGGEYCFNPSDQSYRFTRATRVNNNRFILSNADAPDNRTTFGYGRVRHETGELRAIASPLGRGVRVEAYDETLSSINYGFYLQDRWAIMPNLVVSAGARWEVQDMRDIYGDSQVLIWDNIAPRVGVVYDWTDEGRSRLYASYGWFFQPLPLQLNSRTFGGLVQVVRGYQQNDCLNQNSNIGGDSFARTDDDQLPTEWCVDSGGDTSGLTAGAVAPGLKGPYNAQFQLGYEQELIEDLVVNLRWVHQDLGRAVEDVSTNGGQLFLIANPGEEVADKHIIQQQAQCAELQQRFDGMSDMDDDRVAVGRDLRRCEFLADAFQQLGTMFPKPKRTMDAWTLQLTRRLAKGWSVRASYTYSRQVGNYDGYVNPNTGVVNLGASTQYDIPELVRNSFGPLSGTVPHMINLDGIYSFDFRKNGRLTLGASFRYRSGLPINVRTDTPQGQYRGQNLVYLLPRGAGGRMEPNYRVNLTTSYAYPLRKDLELEVIARLINVTNARAVLRVDDVYSFEGARPIAGGDIGDLKHAKVHSPGGGDGFFDREIVRPQGNYGVETRFQQPLSGQFELALRF